MSHSCWI